MQKLFVYGTLVSEARTRQLLDRTVQKQPAILRGWRKITVASADYPAIVEDKDSVVDGYIIEVSSGELAILDDYEGVAEELFDRVAVCVEMNGGTQQASTYAAGAVLRKTIDRETFGQ